MEELPPTALGDGSGQEELEPVAGEQRSFVLQTTETIEEITRD